MRNVKIDSSTDTEFARRAAGTQPYNSVSMTIVTAGPSVKREDGSIEHGEDDVQNFEALVPGRELRHNMALYEARVEEFKQRYPDFEKYVNQNIPIPLSVRDEILRSENGPDIALFLGFCPDVAEKLCEMDGVDAAERTENISEDLERAELPSDEGIDYAAWKQARNLQLQQRAAKESNVVKKAPRKP